MNKVTPISKKKVAPAKKPSFNIQYDIENLLEHGSGTIDIYKGNSNFFTFDLTQLPHCCGVFEIGNIGSLKLTTATIKALESFIDKALKKLVSEYIKLSDLDKKGSSITFICNTINNQGCNLIKESFIRTGLFTKVKEFVNYNSHNKVEMWVSNN